MLNAPYHWCLLCFRDKFVFLIDVFSVSVIKYFLSLMPSPCLTTPTTQTEKSLFCKFKEVTICFYESSVPNPNKIVLESICIITLSLLPIPVGLLVLPCTRHCRRYPPPPPFHPPPFVPVPDRGTSEGRYLCPWQACAKTACSDCAR